MQVGVDDLRHIMRDKLKTTGVRKDHASLIAEAIIDAERSGVTSHGLVRFPTYLSQLKNGFLKATPNIKTVVSESIIQMDGDNGPGIVVANEAMRACVETAKKTGICSVSVKRSNHFGAAAYYTRKAAEKGCVGFICSTAGPSMAPFGGKDLLLGTDPFSVSFPYSDQILSIDIASSASAKGKIRLYADAGKPIPLNWALNRNGLPTTDAKEAMAGIMLPMGGHKGYGIALVIEALSALLSGAKLSCESEGMSNVTSIPNIGHFAVAVDIEHYLPLVEFRERAGEWMERIRNAELCPGVEKIYIPGEIELAYRERHKQYIEISERLYQKVINA